MSLPLPDVHVRLSTEVDEELALYARTHQVPKGTAAAHLLTEALMGKTYVLRVACQRAVGVGLGGIMGEDR